jgi:hypothetical protein
MEYITLTKECGVNIFVEPKHFWERVLVPAIDKAVELGPGNDVHVAIDERYQLVVKLEGEGLKAGISPMSLFPERSTEDVHQETEKTERHYPRGREEDSES